MTYITPMLRWTGSKSAISEWIQSYAPPHKNKNIPFAGSLGYFLNSPRAKMEAVNDLDQDLVNFLITLRDYRTELTEAIEQTYFSPRELEIAELPTDDPVESARRFYTRCWLSFKPYENGRSLSFRRQYVQSDRMVSAAKLFTRTNHLRQISNRLRGVTIDHMPAMAFIAAYDHEEAFFYIDPPYPFSTRARKTPIYAVDNMDDGAHTKLATKLWELKGKVIISGYKCQLYTDLYESHGWKREDKRARVNGGRSALESIWINPAAQVRRLL